MTPIFPDQIPLNVLAVVCPHYWMEKHLVPTLKETFRNVEIFYYEGMARWDDPAWVAARPAEMKRLLAAVQSLKSAGKLDLLFMVVYDDFLFPETAAAIRKMGVRMINYHVDMPTQWYRCIRIAPYLDLMGVSHLSHFDDLEKWGARLLFAPMAANTDHFLPLPVQKEYDVLFVGGYTPPRADALAAAKDVTNSIYVLGTGWDKELGASKNIDSRKSAHWEKYVHDLPYLWPRVRADGLKLFAARDLGKRMYPKGGRTGGAICLGYQTDIVETICKARIVLGINQRWGSLGSKNGRVDSRLRDFEVPACGSLYLVQRYDELSKHYREDQEVAAWSTLDELRAQLNDLLTREKRREAIAQAGRQRVLKSHQWKHRYLSMYEYLENPH